MVPSPHGEETPSKHSGDPLADAAKQWHEKSGEKTTSASGAAQAFESTKPPAPEAPTAVQGSVSSAAKQSITDGADPAESAADAVPSEKPTDAEIVEGEVGDKGGNGFASAAKQSGTDGAAKPAEGAAGDGVPTEKPTYAEIAAGEHGGDASEQPHPSPIADRLHAVEHSIATHASGAVELVVQAEQKIQHAIGHGFEAVKKKIVGDSSAQPQPASKAA